MQKLVIDADLAAEWCSNTILECMKQFIPLHKIVDYGSKHPRVDDSFVEAGRETLHNPGHEFSSKCSAMILER